MQSGAQDRIGSPGPAIARTVLSALARRARRQRGRAGSAEPAERTPGQPRASGLNAPVPAPRRRSCAMQMNRDDLVVVTGAGGFIGGHLVSALREQGFKHLRAVEIKPLAGWYQRFDGVENLQADLSLREQAYEAVKGGRYVFNLAADMGGMGFIESNRACCMLSVLTSTHVLMAAKEHRAEQLFYSSSACVY